jgi:hypothetical protein
MDRYLEILNADESLSAVFAKNLAKALHSLREQEPSKQTEAGISAIVLIEMFCDRFSMFLFENYAKIRIYRSLLGELYGDPFSVSTMLNFEEERKRDPEAFITKHPEVTREIMTHLNKAEAVHVYTDPETFGDPLLGIDERTFFGAFLNLLRHFNRQGTILQFSPQHTANSRVMRATFSGLISRTRYGFRTIK